MKDAPEDGGPTDRSDSFRLWGPVPVHPAKEGLPPAAPAVARTAESLGERPDHQLFDAEEAPRPSHDGTDRPGLSATSQSSAARGQGLVIGAAAAVILAVLAAVLIGLHLRGGHKAAGIPLQPSSGPIAAPVQSVASSPPGTSTGSVGATAKPIDPGIAAAQQVDVLLDKSETARSGIGTAISNIAHCAASSSDFEALGNAGSSRRQLINELSSVHFTALRGGATLSSELKSLWTLSALADDAYQAWGQDEQSCVGSASVDDSQFVRAAELSSEVDKIKDAFVKQWNALAARYQLRPRSAKAI